MHHCVHHREQAGGSPVRLCDLFLGIFVSSVENHRYILTATYDNVFQLNHSLIFLALIFLALIFLALIFLALIFRVKVPAVVPKSE